MAAIEQRLGARLLHRSTRGVTPTEVGALYYDKCKVIAREIEEADNLATLLQGGVGGQLRISTSVGFGRRVLVPLVLRYMQRAPGAAAIDLSFDDRYVNLVEQGVDLAIRMGRLADSSLGARYLGINPWVMVAAPTYLAAHGTPRVAGRPGAARLPDLQQRAGRRPLALHRPDGEELVGAGARARCARTTCRPCWPLRAPASGSRSCRGTWRASRWPTAAVQPVLTDHALPAQEMHAVFPSPKLVPSKVTRFIEHLQRELAGEWWSRRA